MAHLENKYQTVSLNWLTTRSILFIEAGKMHFYLLIRYEVNLKDSLEANLSRKWNASKNYEKRPKDVLAVYKHKLSYLFSNNY